MQKCEMVASWRVKITGENRENYNLTDLLFRERLIFKRHSRPTAAHKVSYIGMIITIGVFQYVAGIEIPKSIESGLLTQLMQFGEGKYLARAVICISLVELLTITKSRGCEHIAGIDNSHHIGKSNRALLKRSDKGLGIHNEKTVVVKSRPGGTKNTPRRQLFISVG